VQSLADLQSVHKGQTDRQTAVANIHFASAYEHIPASATEVSASLDHVCGKLCRRLCNKTSAVDSLSDSENISVSGLASHVT